MKTFKRLTLYIFFFSALLTQRVMVNCHKHEEHKHKHRKLFVFGDSYADTGNLGKLGEFTPCWYKPYGMSLPKGPSGRFSDGWIFTDYLAKFLGIKTPVPYKYRRVYPTHPYGMNFAVGGSGVFDTGNLQRNLSAQIDTFQEQIKRGVFTKQDVENSVVYISVAGNDYIYYLDNHNVSELSGFIAKVTDQVALDLKRLSEIGAGKIVVANLGPVQCTPDLTRKATNYTKCNVVYDFGPTKHNQLLVEAVKKLNAKSGRARFLVLNLYSAFMAAMNPEKGEGRFKQVLKPCCEGKTPDYHCGAVTDEGRLYSFPLPTMKNTKSFFFYVFLASLAIGTNEVNAFERNTQYDKLFVFGDSYADTGNLGKLDRSLTRCWYEPYGMTFPHRPTGRFSDGKVLPDFIASFIGIKSPIPYKFRRRVTYNLLQSGMNFAVAGTGVFDLGNFQRNLSAQIDTFQAQINENIYSQYDLNSSVALVSISGNDYMHFLQTHNNTNDIWDYIENLTAVLKLEIKRIHDLGVKKVVVTNLTPLEFTPMATRSNNYTMCDSSKSAVVDGHNNLLNEVVNQLHREGNSSCYDILVLDLHSAFMSIINHDKKALSFENIFRPCCEGKSKDMNCGQVDDNGVKQYTVCKNPEKYLYWDSVHPSQSGWNAVFQLIMPWLSRNLQNF